MLSNVRSPFRVGDQAEVEQHHARLGVTSTFDGLMSRCSLPDCVQRDDAMHELRQRRPEQRQVGGSGLERARETVARVRSMRRPFGCRCGPRTGVTIDALSVGSSPVPKNRNGPRPHTYSTKLLPRISSIVTSHSSPSAMSSYNCTRLRWAMSESERNSRLNRSSASAESWRSALMAMVASARGVEGLVHHAKGPRPDAPSDLEPGAADEIAAQHVGTCTGIIQKDSPLNAARRNPDAATVSRATLDRPAQRRAGAAPWRIRGSGRARR